MKPLTRAAALALGGLVLLAAPVSAATFDDDGDGPSGSVSRRDVQEAFGWTRRDFREYALVVDFRITSYKEHTWSCLSPDGSHEYFRTVTVQRAIIEDIPRVRGGHVTGFSITPNAGPGYYDYVFVEGDPGPYDCPAGYEFGFDDESAVIDFQYEATADDWATFVPVD